MKRILYAGLIALALMGVILALDRFLFAEDFGLWSYTLGAFAESDERLREMTRRIAFYERNGFRMTAVIMGRATQVGNASA